MTTRTQIPLEVDAVYNKELLFRAVHLLVHDKWAKKSTLKGNGGSNLMRFRRYTTLTSSTTPLTEGTTPSDTQIAQTNFTVTLNQYGTYATITDRINYESVDPVLLETVGIMGDQMGQSLDDITRDVIHSGTQVIYCGGQVARTSLLVTHNVTYSEIEKAVELLKVGITRKITPIVNATGNINTSPINSAYIAVVTPNLGKQLKRLTQFIRVENYSSTMTVMDGEIGKIDDVRVIETTNAKVFVGGGSGGIDVHSMVIFGKEAYANVAIDSEMGRSFIKDFGSAGTADPLEQRATVGWKATFASTILNNNFIVRIESGKAA